MQKRIKDGGVNIMEIMIWLFWGIIIIIIIVCIEHIIHLKKKLKLQEKYRKIHYYLGEIYLSKDKKIKYRIPEFEY